MNNALPQHNQQQNMGMMHTRRGFSLVEVLVVLVVLVVGILAIVRLFPAGFLALRNAQNSTFADRLGQAALESLKQGQGTLPDAVYMYVDGTNPGFDPTVPPDNLYGYTVGTGVTHQNGLLTDAYSDINKQRYVSNETISVPAAHVVGNVMYPPLYAVAFGPIVSPSSTKVGDGIGTLPYLSVNSVPWTSQIGDSRVDPSDPNATNPSIARHFTNPADTLSPTQGAYLADLAAALAANTPPLPTLRPTQTAYMVDVAAGQIAVPTASYEQKFTLTITQKYGGSTTQMLTVPALGYDANAGAPSGYTGGWFQTADTTTSGTVLPSTAPVLVGTVLTPNPWVAMTLTRSFQYMGVLPAPADPMPFTADPYQYCLAADNIAASGTTTQTTENMGVLAFNPAAGGQNGIAPLQAQVSYQTLNWHILHEDLTVPSGGGTLKLVLDHLKRVGDVQFDGTVFAGLAANADPASQYDLLLLDRDTGDIYGFRGTGGSTAAIEYTNGAPTDLKNTYTVDVVDNGDDPSAAPTAQHIVLNYAGGRITLPAMFQGKHFRAYYAGDADWAVAVQKAPSVYRQTTTLADFSTITSTTPNVFYVPTDGTTRLLFPPCDAGKTVELNVTYNAMNGTKAVQRTLPAVAFSISAAPATLGGTDYYLELGPVGPNGTQGADVLQGDTNITNLKVGARGISLRAVVIWRERNIWRTRATDTLLTRGAQ